MGKDKGVGVYSILRDTVRLGGQFWVTVGKVLGAHVGRLILLFLLGWAGYYLTVLATGLLAPRWAGAVIALMAAGCLIQMVIWLAAYRTCIDHAADLMGAPPLPRTPFVRLIETVLVPFAAAYSVFGFFETYAHDSAQASEALVGTFATAAFLGKINPLASTSALLITLGVFVVLWAGSRALKIWASRVHSTVLMVVSSFLTMCAAFLVLFSLFRVKEWIGQWITTRAFMGWRDAAVNWLGERLHLNLPEAVASVWDWVAGTGWPVFWHALARPVLWLTIVALIGGMQVVRIETVWSRIRTRLGLAERTPRTHELTREAGKEAVGFVEETLLPFLHLLTVVLRAGVPFLGALTVSYALVVRGTAWLLFLVERLAGPVAPQWVFITAPLYGLVDMVLQPLLLAVLLAVALVHLRRENEALAPARPGLSWRPAVVAVLCIALAGAISQIEPPSPDVRHGMAEGTPLALATGTVQLTDVRVGYALTDDNAGYGPVQSQGVFVAVNVAVSGYQSLGVTVTAVTGGVEYPTWDNNSRLINPAGFRSSRDFVFEIPADKMGDVTITITPIQSVSWTLAIGSYRLPGAPAIADVILVDQQTVKEVP